MTTFYINIHAIITSGLRTTITIDTKYYNIHSSLASLYCNPISSNSLHNLNHRFSIIRKIVSQPKLLLSTAYSSPTHYIFIHRIRAQNPNCLPKTLIGPSFFPTFFPTCFFSCFCASRFLLSC